MRLLRLVFCVSILWSPLFAQDASHEPACRKSETPFEERIAACTALIETEGYESKSWAYQRRGDAYSDNRDYVSAIEDFNRSLEIDPLYEVALGKRAYALYQESRYEEALVDTTLLIEIDPEDHWNFYYHGRILDWLDRNTEALFALTQAIELRGDYFYSRYQRGHVHHKMENYALATADYQSAREISPFGSFIHMRLADNYRDMGDADNAARYYRMAQIINPNVRFADRNLEDLVQLSPDVQIPPLQYEPPDDGLRIRYLQVFLPFDTRDEMEIAIMDLANWFSAPPKAMPEALALITRNLTVRDDNVVQIDLDLEAEKNLDAVTSAGGKIPESIDTFRGLFLRTLRTEDGGPEFRKVFEEGEPAMLWPLAVGNTVTGRGGFELVCPEEFSMDAMMMGCLHDVPFVQLGTLEFSLVVEKQEQIHEPLGVFDTFVVRYRELSKMEAFGREVKREVETRWWISPELGFWVKRTNQRGDKIASLHAVSILEN